MRSVPTWSWPSSIWAGEGITQVVIFLLNSLTVVVARLWPMHPHPYPFTLRHFLFSTLPYAVFNGLPFLLFFVLTSLPAILALVQASARHRPPSRPVWGG